MKRCFFLKLICWIGLGLSMAANITGCGSNSDQPIKIGFSGCLTGRLSDLGISGRDGVLLAVEEINRLGGINNRRIQLMVRDDQHDVQEAKRVDSELIGAGVEAIVGHMTSAMSMAVVPLMNQHKVVLFSPTTSTNLLTGIDDYFFRAIPPNVGETRHLAEYAIRKLKLETMAVVYDLSNTSFTKGWYQHFASAFIEMGGQVRLTETFTSGKGVNFMDLACRIGKSGVDGLVIIGGAIDTAMICQQLRKIKWTRPIIGSGWSKTDELIRHGGRSVDGLILSTMMNHENQELAFIRFKTAFEKRFGRMPDFAATFSYDSAQMIFKALSKKTKGQSLKDALLQLGPYDGVQGEVKLDPFGDATRQRFYLTIKDGQFRIME